MSNKPSAIAVEPLADQKAAILTLLIQLPSGDLEYTPTGQCGLALGSALVSIGGYLFQLHQLFSTICRATECYLLQSCFVHPSLLLVDHVTSVLHNFITVLHYKILNNFSGSNTALLM